MTIPAMIFAAGKGTRMAPLTDTCPKPLIKVAGRALIEYAREQVSGADGIVVNANYLAQQISDHFAGQGVTVLHEAKLLDTGGGLKNARRALCNDHAATINSDAIWTGPRALDQLLANWDPAKMDALLLCVPRGSAVGHQGAGDFDQRPDGTLIRGGDLVYTGAQIISLGLLDDIEQDVFSLHELWNKAAADGRMYGLIHQGKWCDVGHPAGIGLAERLLADVDV